MHGDIIFNTTDEKAKKTILEHIKEAEALYNMVIDLSITMKEERDKAWALLHELMKAENKKMPRGRAYIIDKEAKVVDVGPAPRKGQYAEVFDGLFEDSFVGCDEDDR